MTSTSSDRRLGMSSGVAFKAPAQVATTSNITLSGEQTIDGVLTASSRVLVKDQDTASENGVYTSDSGSWERTPDFDGALDIVQGTLIYVNQGVINTGVIFIVASANPIIIGSSNIVIQTLVFAGTQTIENITVLGDTILGDTITGGNTTVILGDGDVFEITNVAGDTLLTITEEGDLLFTGDSIFEGDTIFEGTVDLPDNTVTINDLTEEVLNLILSSGGGGGGSSSGSLIASGNGRLTFASGVKVMVTDYTSQSTVYYTGSLILLLNDGTGAFQPQAITELSSAIANTTRNPAATSASKAYDLFGWTGASQSVTSLTHSTVTALATKTSHGYATGETISISGATPSGYNGAFLITVLDANSFSYVMSSDPGADATGTITMKGVFLSRGPAWRNRGQIITDATNATPIVITANSHGLSNGDLVEIAGVQGNTAANGSWVVASTAANTFALTGSVGNAAYVAGTGALAARGAGSGTSALTLIGSTYVNAVAITNGPAANMGTYLGTMITNAGNTLDWKLGTAATNGGEAWLGVWNVSNQVTIRPSARDTTSTWSYTSGTARAMNNSNTNRLTTIRGLNADSVQVTCLVAGSTYKGSVACGIGLNSTAVQAPNNNWASISSAGTAAGDETGASLTSFYIGSPGLGVNYFQALEIAGGTPTVGAFFGATGAYTAAVCQIQNLFGDFLM